MCFPANSQIRRNLEDTITADCKAAAANIEWLQQHMHPYFFLTLQNEPKALARLALNIDQLGEEQKLVLADRENALVVARPSSPGSLYDTLMTLQERNISFAQFIQSSEPIPGLDQVLEVQSYEFNRKSSRQVAEAGPVEIPDKILRAVRDAAREHFPDFEPGELEKLLEILWINNSSYVSFSPPRRVAQVLWLFQRCQEMGGVYFDVQEMDPAEQEEGYRILFAAGNPPQRDFLSQTLEVFKRLQLGIERAYCLTLDNSIHPYFLGTFYVKSTQNVRLFEGSVLFDRLQQELYNTQILSTGSQSYGEFVIRRVMSGEEASLVNAFIGFCHTNLAHNQPDRFVMEDVIRAFHSHPDITLRLVRLFRTRFDPDIEERAGLYGENLEEVRQVIENYNTGHRFLDDFRRTIFRCCLMFIRHTLKTNFFVAEKHALAFRLDPIYLEELGRDFTADLPAERPFRITYFYGRYGAGYHIGFSDIARGGWRTIVTGSRDDYVTCANTIFRENYVLAHTQHLKNKDIYEGGSKMAVVLNAAGETDQEMVTQRLYKLQYGLINAFLDIFVTEEGRARDPRVVDYYGEDEPIELGPDENMHDAMVELIAGLSRKRGYMLGAGLISSKKAGINHKEFGVTSTGVVKFAEITLAEVGIDMHRDPFSVKFTGGPGGDVAGNAMHILIERCPQVAIRLIVDGSGALCDPSGACRQELARLLLKQDLEAFRPERLGPGGFILYRNQRRKEGMRELHKKVVCTESGLEEQWVTIDEFYREYNNLLFTVPADLFIPGGGRPETIDGSNWRKFFREDGSPSAKAIVEGANSFITPEARTELQNKGVIIMRDASANKCGVISSSYEIIANLLLKDREFLEQKERYVADVVEILEKRAEDEARLIFRRRREPGCKQSYTEISNAVSMEINEHYAGLFSFFQEHPDLCGQPLFQRVIHSHLPNLLRNEPEYRERLSLLPQKYLYAILASEIASSLVYRGDPEMEFAEMLKGHLTRNFPADTAEGRTSEAGMEQVLVTAI